MKELTLSEFAKYCEKHMGKPTNSEMDTTHVRRYEGMYFIYNSRETTVKSTPNAKFSYPLYSTGFSHVEYCNVVIISLHYPDGICFKSGHNYIRFNSIEKITIETEPSMAYPSITYGASCIIGAEPLTYDVIRIICKGDKNTCHTIFAVREVYENGG